MKSALEAVPGAQQVEISLKQKQARVVYDTSETTVTVLLEAVRDAGFEVKEKK